jgi:hypothetical protein
MASDGSMPIGRSTFYETLQREKLCKISEQLNEQLSFLQLFNSMFPATQAFLKSCNAVHVAELSRDQVHDLKAHLHQCLARVSS